MDIETIRNLYRLNELALVIIDAQKNFCRTRIGTNASQGIIEAKNELTKLGILTFLVFMDHNDEGPMNACGGLIDNLLRENDRAPIPKKSNDATTESDLISNLIENDIKGVIIAGNSADGCILTSMRSLQKDFEVAGITTAIGSFYQGKMSIARTFHLMRSEGFGMHALNAITSTLTNQPTSP